MHRFTISLCKSVLEFNGNLMIQFLEGKGYQEIRTKHLSLKIKEVTSNIAITEKKEKQIKENMLDESYIPTRGIIYKNYLWY